MTIEREGDLPLVETKPLYAVRKIQILQARALGLKEEEIAQELKIAWSTVSTYLRKISAEISKGLMKGSMLAMVDAIRQGLISKEGIPVRDVGILTLREKEVLRHISEGEINKQIAQSMFISPATVNTHAGSIYSKLGARNRYHAVAIGIVSGLIE